MEEICKFTSLLPSEKNEGWNSSAQRDTFIELFKIPFIAENFWLAGGTCLSAMYLGHRRSDDIDLFTTCNEIHPSAGVKIIDILRREFEFDMPTVVNPNFTSMLINGTKVEFVADMFAYKCKRPEIILDNVACKVDSWDNLCVAKFSAFLSRTSDKDISDLGAILKTAKDDGEFKDMANFLIYETRKRDSMADELTNIFEISSYASKNTRDLSYKNVLLKFAGLVLEFQKEITQEVFLSTKNCSENK